MLNQQQERAIIEKLRALPPERVAEVEDFVDFLRSRSEERALVTVAATLAEDAFGKVWDNDSDGDYAGYEC